jgi:hypothetical protein
MDGIGTQDSVAVRPLLERLGASAAQLSSLSPSRPLLRRTLWFSLAVLVAASVALAVVGSWSNLPSVEWHVHAGWLALGVLAFGVLYVVHAGLWRRVVESLLHTSTHPSRMRAVWCTSGLARYTPGSVLMIMVRVAMAEKEGVPKRVCLASIVYELALLSTGATLVGAYAVTASSLDHYALRWAVLAVPAIALCALHPRVFTPLANFALSKLGRERLPSALPFTRVLFFAGVYALTWVLAGAGLYALIRGIYGTPESVGLLAFAAPAVGYFTAQIAFFSPGGLGAREGGVALVLAAGLPVGAALAVAIALRLVQLGVELVCAAAAPMVARARSG